LEPRVLTKPDVAERNRVAAWLATNAAGAVDDAQLTEAPAPVVLAEEMLAEDAKALRRRWKI
jgi:hypothetical protein